MRVLLLALLPFFLGACTIETAENGRVYRLLGLSLAEFVLAPYYITLIGIAVVLWGLILLVALILEVLPKRWFVTQRDHFSAWQPNANHAVAILLAVATLGFSVGYIAGNSRETIIGSIITAAMSAIGGVVAYWFARAGHSRTLSAIAAALFTVVLIYGGQIGARWRVDYEIWQTNFDALVEAQKATKAAELESLMATHTSELLYIDNYNQMQVNIEEYRVKKLIDLEAESEATMQESNTLAPATPQQAAALLDTRAFSQADVLKDIESSTTAASNLLRQPCIYLCGPSLTPPPTPEPIWPSYPLTDTLPDLPPFRLPALPPFLPPFIPADILEKVDVAEAIYEVK